MSHEQPILEWIVETHSVAGQSIALRIPRRPEAVLADVAANSTRESDPYWGYLWPSASILAELVLKHAWARDTTTLELGCGSGLVGIAALMAGLEVTLSDLVPEAVQLAQENAVANGFINAKSLVLDWRQPLDQQFKVLLASDVLYHPDLHQPLATLIEQMMHPDGECWIADPGRDVAREFLQVLSECGLSYTLRNEEGSDVLMPLPGRFVLIVVKKR